jgi:GNAT superfamily N-acetyltransferase
VVPAADVHVRSARADDAVPLAELQVRAWLDAYGGEVPDEVLQGLAGSPDDHAESWRESVVSPPSPRHRVLVAVEDTAVVGVSAVGPADDDDTDPADDAEVLTFLVDPQHRGQGHGSRLLAASVDHLRAVGFVRGLAWIDATDEAGRGLLRATGWAPDGSFRTLDLDGDGRVVVRQVRLHTTLEEH